MKNNHGKCFFILCFSLLITTTVFSQRKSLPKVEILNTGVKTSIRGLSVVNNNVVWVSGSNGMVGKSANAGKNWKWMTVKGFEKNIHQLPEYKSLHQRPHSFTG